MTRPPKRDKWFALYYNNTLIIITSTDVDALPRPPPAVLQNLQRGLRCRLARLDTYRQIVSILSLIILFSPKSGNKSATVTKNAAGPIDQRYPVSNFVQELLLLAESRCALSIMLAMTTKVTLKLHLARTKSHNSWSDILALTEKQTLGRWVTMRYSGALRRRVTVVRYAVGLLVTTCVTVRYSANSLHRVCRQR